MLGGDTDLVVVFSYVVTAQLYITQYVSFNGPRRN